MDNINNNINFNETINIIKLKQAVNKIQNNITSIMEILRKHYQESKQSIMTIYCSNPSDSSSDFSLDSNDIPKVEFRFPFNEQIPDMLAHCSEDDLYQNNYPWISSLFEVLKMTTNEELPDKCLMGIPKTTIVEAKVKDVMYYLRNDFGLYPVD